MATIRETIAKELKKVGLVVSAADLDHPKDLKNGDFSIFIKDKEIAPEKLPLEKIKHKYVSKVVPVGRFLNIYLSEKYFADTLEEIIESEMAFGRNKNLKGEKIIVEYTDPNLFKELHIGHLMSNTIGESLSRIIEWSGAKVTRANYESDIGLNVAKAIWGMKKNIDKIPDDRDPIKERSAFLGSSYVFGSNTYEENPEAKKEIDALNKKIYEKSDAEVNQLYDWGRKVSLEHFEELYEKLGTDFDMYFFESASAPLGLFAVDELVKKGILEKSEGAIVFKGEQYGLHTRVFVNSQGLPTYETKELGLSKMKFDQVDWDQSIVITASEQADYFKVLLKVLEFFDHRAANRTRHISHGMMRFAEGKMSSRKGNVITGESLISDVEALVQEKIKDRQFSEEEKKVVATDVAVGAIKYSILKQSPGKDIIFDFEKSLSFEGDSGPYLQYTHARCCSIINKAREEKISESVKKPETPKELERLLVKFPDIVERAQKEFAPQLITTYLVNVASAFNHYYVENQIVNKEKPESAYRLALTWAVKNVLMSGLYLIGIRAPEKM